MDRKTPRQTSRKSRTPGLISGYRPLPAIPDEMIDGAGNIRPGWAQLLAGFDELGPEGLTARFERADQYLRDAGVFYRKYDGAAGKERAWPLAHVPLIIGEDDWQTISHGLVQRADLLEKLMGDIYGDNHLVARGVLPPELIARNPEFLRPVVGIKPASGHYLHFCAFELG